MRFSGIVRAEWTRPAIPQDRRLWMRPRWSRSSNNTVASPWSSKAARIRQILYISGGSISVFSIESCLCRPHGLLPCKNSLGLSRIRQPPTNQPTKLMSRAVTLSRVTILLVISHTVYQTQIIDGSLILVRDISSFLSSSAISFREPYAPLLSLL
jgi:hypothetical protein